MTADQLVAALVPERGVVHRQNRRTKAKAATRPAPEQARQWLRGKNLALGERPLDLLPKAEGLIRVLHYLDAARGRI